jgi:hypothetical protein
LIAKKEEVHERADKNKDTKTTKKSDTKTTKKSDTKTTKKSDTKTTKKATTTKKNNKKDKIDKTPKPKPKSILALTIPDIDTFDFFKSNFKKDYKNEKHEAKRLLGLVTNKRKMEEQNQKYEDGESAFEMGLWKHSDMPAEEIVETMTGFVAKARAKTVYTNDFPSDVPDHVNYTEQGLISDIQDQGICGGKNYQK